MKTNRKPSWDQVMGKGPSRALIITEFSQKVQSSHDRQTSWARGFFHSKTVINKNALEYKWYMDNNNQDITLIFTLLNARRSSHPLTYLWMQMIALSTSLLVGCFPPSPGASKTSTWVTLFFRVWRSWRLSLEIKAQKMHYSVWWTNAWTMNQNSRRQITVCTQNNYGIM